MTPRTTYLGWAALALAILVWTGVGFMGWRILVTADAHAASAVDTAQASDRAAFSGRLQTLAKDTKEEREKLEALVSRDAISIVGALESAGIAAGVETTVRGATKVKSVEVPGSAELQTVEFVVETSGSFTKLVNALALFERLPLPSVVGDVEFELDTTGGERSGGWRMIVHVLVLTNVQIST